MPKRHLATLLSIAVLVCSCGSGGANSSDGDEWGGPCDAAACQYSSGHENHESCECVSDRCICRCDPGLCNNECIMHEMPGFCGSDGGCHCQCSPYGCPPDPTECTPAARGCPDGASCLMRSCIPGSVGTCVSRPSSCDSDWMPACACDGTWYRNECELLRAGVQAVSPGGTCGEVSCVPKCRTDPSGATFWMFPCTGEYLCNADCAGCEVGCGGAGWQAACPDRHWGGCEGSDWLAREDC